MTCHRFRLALSADLDGEPADISARTAHDHLSRCPACAAWYDSAVRITRSARLAIADEVPDLAAELLPLLPPARSRRRLLATARAALVVVGLAQAVLAWPAIVLDRADPTGVVHAAHETGAWNLALAVAFLGAAGRPSAAAALIAPIGTFVGVLSVIGTLDALAGAVTLQRLAGHLIAAAGMVLLIVVRRLSASRPGFPNGRPGSGERSTTPGVGRWSRAPHGRVRRGHRSQPASGRARTAA